MTTEKKEPLQEDIDKLRAHPLFHKLTDKQKAFLVKFVEFNGDSKKAACSVYHCETEVTAEGQARRLMRMWQIRKILSACTKHVLEGYAMTQDEAVHLISARLREKMDIKWFAQLMALLARMERWDEKKWSPITHRRTKPKAAVENSEEKDVHKLVLALERQRKGDHGKSEENQG